jgi:hypothetical protein
MAIDTTANGVAEALLAKGFLAGVVRAPDGLTITAPIQPQARTKEHRYPYDRAHAQDPNGTWEPPIAHADGSALSDEVIFRLWESGRLAAVLGIPKANGNPESVAGGSGTVVATSQEKQDLLHCLFPGRTRDPLWLEGLRLMPQGKDTTPLHIDKSVADQVAAQHRPWRFSPAMKVHTPEAPGQPGAPFTWQDELAWYALSAKQLGEAQAAPGFNAVQEVCSVSPKFYLLAVKLIQQAAEQGQLATD